MIFKKWAQTLILVVATLVLAGCQPDRPQGKVQAQKGYIELSSRIEALPEGGKVLVREFFWYGCPHCYAAYPEMEELAERSGEWAKIEYSPAPLNQSWEVGTRLHYAAKKQKGAALKMGLIYLLIHKGKINASDLEGIAAGLAKAGFDAPLLISDAKSKEADELTARERDLALRAQIDGTPAILVNGKYLVTTEIAGSSEGLAKAAEKVGRKILSGELPK